MAVSRQLKRQENGAYGGANVSQTTAKSHPKRRQIASSLGIAMGRTKQLAITSAPPKRQATVMSDDSESTLKSQIDLGSIALPGPSFPIRNLASAETGQLSTGTSNFRHRLLRRTLSLAGGRSEHPFKTLQLPAFVRTAFTHCLTIRVLPSADTQPRRLVQGQCASRPFPFRAVPLLLSHQGL